ncbi:uncharacterized protein LOC125305939 [Alosa alosa]|uniref:uncharacterized protein LOC125305939 n=1 Tax=Alosa alosa TaxID=278164 RepID=UPI00201509AA|nr:uncharacterized protein LOC125305939 [Alosa alosa]
MKVLCLLLLLVGYGLYAAEAFALVNVASRGRTTQSSTFNSSTAAKKAIDGNRSGVLLEGSCAHTEAETNPWWRIDLLETYRVASVKITNRQDCCAENINGAEIHIGNSLEHNGNTNPRCAVISSIPAGGASTFQCNGMEGRYVNIFSRGYRQHLTLCEVEVNAAPVPVRVDIQPTTLNGLEISDPPKENVALNKQATQSSQYNYLGSPNNAVDGRRNARYSERSCSRTKTQINPWWRVDLLRPHSITMVTITNREDNDPEMIDGAEIRIGNSLENNGNNNPLCDVISSFPAWESKTFYCRGHLGRYVNIFLPGCDKHLALCEVEVNATPEQGEEIEDEQPKPAKTRVNTNCPNTKTVLENAATGGTATQSSQLDALGGANNAIDRNRSSTYSDGSCSQTKAEIDPWWWVNLGKVHNVTFVTVTNRGDCCSDRISGAEIRVGNYLDNEGNNNPLCAVIPYIPAGQIRTFECGGMEGRYVNILLPGREKYLTLCEVEVHASTFQPGLPLSAPPSAVPNKAAPNPYLTWLWAPWQKLRHPVPQSDNVAVKGRATQSSQFSRLTHAENAIDGSLDAEYLSGSCAHTRLQSDPWWRVDLLAVHRVDSLTITNREDCCEWRLDGAEILVGNSLENNGNSNPVCAVVSSIPAGESITFQCHGMEGRYVNIIRPGCFKFLSLCEVEVHARPVSGVSTLNTVKDYEDKPLETQCPDVQVPENIASQGNATQSSQYDHLGNANNAIDRKRNPLYHAGSCSHTKRETNPWWKVDLMRSYRVTSVTITNRGDCCAERINGAEIHIGNSLENHGHNNPLCGVISDMREGDSVTFWCRGMEGRYVSVFLPGRRRYLTLCEVEVNSTGESDPQ